MKPSIEPSSQLHTTQEIETLLLTVVRKFLRELNKGHVYHAVTLSSTLERDLGIDSLGRVELFLRIEKAFAIYLPNTLLAEANSLQDLVAAIKQAKPTLSTVRSQYANVLTATSFDPSLAETLVAVLSKRAEHDPERPHIYLQDDQGDEQVITYENLYHNAAKVARGLHECKIKPGETVAIMLPTCAEFFYAFAGILLMGAIPVPIYPPFRPDRIEEYAIREANILKKAQVRILITFHKAETLSNLLRVFIPSLNRVTTVENLVQHNLPELIYNAKADDGALIQFTSGSTSVPKGVFLRHANLLANIRAIGKVINVQPTDVGVSWLPLYHDMGLIGSWLTTLYYAFPITIMSPLTFLTRPERWLWAIHYHRATYSAAPNFAYELCTRKIDDALIEGLDLSSWRLAFNGAEAINPKTLVNFTKKFARYGFKAETFYPVYGLAENAVALLFPPPGRAPLIDKIAIEPFQKQQRAVTQLKPTKAHLEFVSCGSPLPGHQVRLVDEDLNEVPERTVGRLQFRGPSAMSGYYQNLAVTKAVFFDGWWDSGDLAYAADGEYYITGRKKDIIIKAGRNLYPEEIEEVTSQVSGIRKGCVAAFGVVESEWGTEKLIIVAEVKCEDIADSNLATDNSHNMRNARGTHNARDSYVSEHDAIVSAVIEKVSLVLGIPPDQVILVPPKTIPKTSSGKLQRSACKQAYLNNKLGKYKKPIWLQVSQLFVKSIGAAIKSWLSKIWQSIYTGYVYAVGLASVPPMWVAFMLLPARLRWLVAQYWAKIWLMLAGIRVKIFNRDNLADIEQLIKEQQLPIVYVANHASYVDSIILMSILPPGAAFVAKQELLRVPIVAAVIKKLNYITVDREDIAKGIENTQTIINTLRQKRAVVIYPEGTFSYASGLRPFKMGAFKAAMETNSVVCPIAINGTRRILRGEHKLMRPGSVKIALSKPIEVYGNDWHEVTRLQAAARRFIAKHCGEPTLDFV